MAIPMRAEASTSRGSPRSVTILGSTGSVGCNTIDLVSRNRDDFVVEALTANGNIELLAEQAKKLDAQLAVCADEDRYADLKRALAGTSVEVAAGPEGLLEAAKRPAEWVMAAIVGAAGLGPTLAAAQRGAIVALANKECLVCAGSLMLKEVAESGATLLPVDSEHNAIYQVFDFDRRDQIEKIILTASGGPFRELDIEQMKNVTPAQAIAHPNWDMGAKISVDSATMMNKGLEVIEAFYLFSLPPEQLDVLVHPQSIIHSLVAYVDGSVLAQLGTPDMRTPISYTLGWPKRMSAPSERLDLAQIGELTFEPPDLDRFPALGLAYEALREGAAAPTILNAANEQAVHGFLAEKIGFLDIPRVVEMTLERVPATKLGSLADVEETDRQARETANSLIDGLR